jgi:hypothetical protein
MIRNLLAFGVAAVLEIGGCFAFWIWLRRGGASGFPDSVDSRIQWIPRFSGFPDSVDSPIQWIPRFEDRGDEGSDDEGSGIHRPLATCDADGAGGSWARRVRADRKAPAVLALEPIRSVAAS